MSLPEGGALGTLTDRELLLMVYSKVDTIAMTRHLAMISGSRKKDAV